MVVRFAGVLLRGNKFGARCVFALAAVPGHHHSKRLTQFHRFSPAHDSAHDSSLDELREQMRLVSEQHFQELTLGAARMENRQVESLNGRFRDEVLERKTGFTDLADPQVEAGL